MVCTSFETRKKYVTFKRKDMKSQSNFNKLRNNKNYTYKSFQK